MLVEEAIAPPHTFHHMLMQPTHSTTLNYWLVNSDFTNIFQVDEILTSIVVTLVSHLYMFFTQMYVSCDMQT